MNLFRKSKELLVAATIPHRERVTSFLLLHSVWTQVIAGVDLSLLFFLWLTKQKVNMSETIHIFPVLQVKLLA